ncbi:hypothetical protein ASG38_12505 [Flavobacterium sp. Leaf359]|uniref:hypothetical protein n=1 Tax=Flavobacterium sp. Leaf359 TaxID=1736351 RepID=UPI0006FA5EEE|nr:hypothetical protein [Flavobacterium sp. Leaf359]KQS46603.1 hypothetical protein ASG38_12505 [Flavobacterium sp. Leaf359]
MIDSVFFDYKVDLINNTQHSLKTLDIDELKSEFKGRIYIIFKYDKPKKRNFIVLETGIIDYLLQFNIVIKEIEMGNYTPFSVSCDYYSNSLSYHYFKENDNLEIYEGNDGIFTITCKYKKFKSNYEEFRKKTIYELVTVYPELKENIAFLENFQID